LEFNQSEERKPISSLVNFALISQNPFYSQSQSRVWYELLCPYQARDWDWDRIGI